MVGVCIKYFHENYGGMLQALATISVLERMGLDYELIRYKKEKSLGVIIKNIPRLFNTILLNDKKEALVKKVGKMIHPEFKEKESIRLAEFRRFEKNCFKRLSPEFVGYCELCKGSERYNTVLSGSDQLWSPAGLPTNYYNLKFVHDSIRKVSYASSFGVNNIPWYQRKRTADYLNRIDYISMRENRGAEIVATLTTRDVPVVLDPVLLLNSEEWNRLVPYKSIVGKKYIFSYFLGKEPRFRAVVQKIAHRLGCIVVTLPHLDQYVKADEQFSDIALYKVGPDDFLNLIRNASYICTDSFHGTCFSIIYHKPFAVFNRYSDSSKTSKNSRIDSICTNLGLQKQRFQSGNSLARILSFGIDYDNVDCRLAEMKKKSIEYLQNSMIEERVYND